MSKYYQQLLNILGIVTIGTGLTACTTNLFTAPASAPDFFPPPKVNVNVTSISVNGDYSYIGRKRDASIRVSGARYIQIGDNATYYLPDDTFFIPQSGFIQLSAYPALNYIASDLSNTNVPITVTAYTDDVGGKARNLWLANQEAQNIVTFLWTRGINNISMRAVAMGKEYPYATNVTQRGSRFNRHIEITYRCP